MVDFGRGEIVPFPRLGDEPMELIREDAEHFGCVAEVEQARTIVERGTSSHMQARAYREAMEAGASHEEALRAVVDVVMEATVAGP